MLSKEVREAVLEWEGYITNHVIVCLLAGEQHLRTYDKRQFRLLLGEALFLRRDALHN